MKEISIHDHNIYAGLLTMLSKLKVKTNLSLQININYPHMDILNNISPNDFSEPEEKYFIHIDEENQYGGPI